MESPRGMVTKEAQESPGLSIFPAHEKFPDLKILVMGIGTCSLATRRGVDAEKFDSLTFAETLGGERQNLLVLDASPGETGLVRGLTPSEAKTLPELIERAAKELRSILDGVGQKR